VFKAVAEVIRTTGAHLTCGDSPAIASTIATARKCGIMQAAQEAGVELKEFRDGCEVYFPEGVQNKKFTIAQAVADSDGIISLPKLKTHGFTKTTGAIKNQFGCIPGLLKGEFHVKLPDVYDFARMLVDLDRCVNPRLYIMDGIYAMEGNGPRGGTPRQMKVLLFSVDPVALDATVCRMIDVDPMLVPTIVCGMDAGRGTARQESITLAGDKLESFVQSTFKVNRAKLAPYKINGKLRFLKNLLLPRPVIDKKRCIRCGVCIQMCPANPKAVNWKNGDTTLTPVHSYRQCIRCYCCQELCPEKAIAIHTPLIRRLFSKTT
jgi:uncharacterized protein (DUF362 family)/Pyruvate/2-oxoacid:ferredoxin oxidoreductase delta subunit